MRDSVPGRPGILWSMLFVPWLAVAGLFTCAAPVGPEAADGPSGAAPVSETWQDMLQRDRQWEGDPATCPDAWQSAPFSRERPGIRNFAAPAGRAILPETGPIASTPLLAIAASTPQVIGNGFVTLNLQDQFNLGRGAIPPDTMGAIGPDHFVEVINGSVAVYDRAGGRLSYVSLSSFFTFTFDGITYPRNGSSDPRVLFDHRSNRWYTCALELGEPVETNNNILLAVCRTADPLTGTWDKYLIPVGVPSAGGASFLTDFDTMGMDDNGVYFGMRIFGSDNSSGAKIAATAKSSLIAASPSLSTVYEWDGITDMGSSPQPAHNHDGVGPLGLAWFVSTSATAASGVSYRTLNWSGGVPSLDGVAGVVVTPAYASPLDAPANGSSAHINVVDDRLASAIIRNNRLWTCRAVGVNGNGTDSGADRTACEWLELDVSGSTASLVQGGRVYDPATNGPRYYYFPSIMVNGRGDAAMSFSGSRAAEFVGAYTCGRLAADPAGVMGDVVLMKGGEAPYQRLDSAGLNRWGDYSASSLDPNDDMTIWTIQEYATSVGGSIWGTWTAQLRAPAPTIAASQMSVCQGQTATVNLNGTGFYDPGPGFVNRLASLVSGTGVAVLGVAYNGPTSVNLTISVDYTAAFGPRDIAVTNPDGQTAAAASALLITPGSHFDFNRDCAVDLTDFAFFQACFNGVNNPPAASCTVNADMNGDGDVDLADFGGFQACYNGPSAPPAATCPW